MSENNKGTLYLVPVPIGECPADQILPITVLEKTRVLEVFIVENAKTARAYLKQISTAKPLQEIAVHQLDKHNSNKELISDVFNNSLLKGQDVGVMSESGMPGLADPGSEAVKVAHELGIKVVPLVGPSSLFLAMAASGLNGQNFNFHGYLPKEKSDRKSMLKDLETNSRKSGATHIFIETPYRNEQLFDDMLGSLSGETFLCVASDISGPKQYIQTQKIISWRQMTKPKLKDIPTVFLIGTSRS
ncbi:MAG: SAM-dependent methyltransferase [Bacteroidota bacterium]